MDLPVGDSYEDICSKFQWDIPEYFNIADAVCDRWADDAGRVAITHESLDGSVERLYLCRDKEPLESTRESAS
jgi:acetyl-CoA synthetase